MKISVIPARELDAGARATWLALQRSNPVLASPFFCPEFTLAVADVCSDVRIAILEESNAVAGFFPFQSRWSIGAPAGRLMSDHHGVICAPATRWDWGQLLRATGLSCWRFDNLCASQSYNGGLRRSSSPGMDLSRGFDAYRAGRLATHGNSMRNFERKGRKLEREFGAVRFVENVQDRSVFEAVLELKRDQYRRTGAADVFKLGWTHALLDRIRQVDLPHFGGRLSCLFADDRLVAANLGMRSQLVWHGWFPAYDTALSRFSPGVRLLMLVAQTAAAQGHALLDLGKGDEGYKDAFADHETPLVDGAFTRAPAVAPVFAGAYRAARWVVSTPAGHWLRPLVRRARGL